MTPDPGTPRLKLVEPSELIRFYFICKAQGFSAAALAFHQAGGDRHDRATFRRALDYLREQTQQPLIQLDPFKFLPMGHEVYEMGREQFELAGPRWTQLVGSAPAGLRLGAADYACRAYLARTLDELEAKYGIRLELVPATERELDAMLRLGKIDAAMTSLSGRSIPQTGSELLLEAPLALLVPRQPKDGSAPVTSANYYLGQGTVHETLICAPLEDGLCQVFSEALRESRIHWPNLQRVTSTALVTAMVAHSSKPGLSLNLPVLTDHPNVLALLLRGFPPAKYGLIYRKPANVHIAALLELLLKHAAELRQDLAAMTPPPERAPARVAKGNQAKVVANSVGLF